jgi:hypothetical protein
MTLCKIRLETALCLCLLTISVVSLSQDSSSNARLDFDKLLRDGRSLQRKGQYLEAAKLFRLVKMHSLDSSQQAEAIFQFVNCGDAKAKVLSKDPTVSSDSQLKAFETIGIKIIYLDRYERWSNADTVSRQLLSTMYSHTVWGEESTYDLISDEVGSDGVPIIYDPRVVRERVITFLKMYPSSKFKYDAMHLQGLALQDIWDIVITGGGEFVSEHERKNPEAIRLQAVQALQSTYRHRKQLLKTQWDYPEEEVLKYLLRREHTPYLFWGGC